MTIPNIHFHGNCAEVIEFYKDVFNAQVKVINYAKEAPEDAGLGDLPPDFVMYSEVEICGMVFSLTDGADKPITGENHSFLLHYETEEEVKVVFNKLEAGGRVVEPLSETFWATLYGYVIDKYGVNWQTMKRIEE